MLILYTVVAKIPKNTEKYCCVWSARGQRVVNFSNKKAPELTSALLHDRNH